MRAEATSYTHKEFKVEHYSINWKIDFENTKITGSVTLQIKILEDVNRIVLDSKNLLYHSIILEETHEELNYHVGKSDPCFGSALIINLPLTMQKKDTEFHIVIHYETGQGELCTALLWLTKEQTYLQQYPFMFSQCEAIHARSLLPCQDTPYFKATYSATVEIDSHLMVAMSALPKGTEVRDHNKLYHFEQPIPIPIYLIAIVCGDMTYMSFDKRCGIYAEHGRETEVFNEFKNIPLYLKSAEELCGPYVWTLYNSVCLPGGFAYGGMENPCLTFVTPTLLAGDQSLNSVFLHEIIHSWTGNLVTNRSWDDMWLNEGFTIYLELQLNNVLFGSDIRNLNYLKEKIELEPVIQSLPAAYTCLHLSHSKGPVNTDEDICAIDPDDTFSTVCYTKGASFLYHLTEMIGDETKFCAFLRSYIQEFAYKTVSAMDFISYFEMYFKNELQQYPDRESMYHQWIYEPGQCPSYPCLPSSLPEKVHQEVMKWIQDDKYMGNLDYYNHTSYLEKTLFIEYLNTENVTADIMRHIDSIYHIKDYKNSEVLFSWCKLAIHKDYLEVLPIIQHILETIGRMKFVYPLYTTLYQNSNTKDFAIQIYKENRYRYQSIVQMRVDRLMNY